MNIRAFFFEALTQDARCSVKLGQIFGICSELRATLYSLSSSGQYPGLDLNHSTWSSTPEVYTAVNQGD
jgi:hypothetical protein